MTNSPMDAVERARGLRSNPANRPLVQAEMLHHRHFHPPTPFLDLKFPRHLTRRIPVVTRVQVLAPPLVNLALDHHRPMTRLLSMPLVVEVGIWPRHASGQRLCIRHTCTVLNRLIRGEDRRHPLLDNLPALSSIAAHSSIRNHWAPIPRLKAMTRRLFACL